MAKAASSLWSRIWVVMRLFGSAVITADQNASKTLEEKQKRIVRDRLTYVFVPFLVALRVIRLVFAQINPDFHIYQMFELLYKLGPGVYYLLRSQFIFCSFQGLLLKHELISTLTAEEDFLYFTIGNLAPPPPPPPPFNFYSY
ncbi:hypothetical protein Bca4012_024338 [Brassica carinata]